MRGIFLVVVLVLVFLYRPAASFSCFSCGFWCPSEANSKATQKASLQHSRKLPDHSFVLFGGRGFGPKPPQIHFSCSGRRILPLNIRMDKAGKGEGSEEIHGKFARDGRKTPVILFDVMVRDISRRIFFVLVPRHASFIHEHA